MISINNSLEIEISGMGLFETFDDWTHPTVQVETYELIYCLSGDLKIFEEEDKKYLVKPNQILLLEPKKTHGGHGITTGHTSFYWLHFRCSDITQLQLQKLTNNHEDTKRIFREIIHYYRINKVLADLAFAKFLLEYSFENILRNKTVYEIDEFLRINSRRALTVSEVSEKFNYSPDHISKMFKREFRQNLKERINHHRLSLIDALLSSTNDSIKQIAAKTGFSSENDFVKFYKYNKGITPTNYRNSFYQIRMNNR